MPAVAPYVEHQKALTIRNDVNLKKDTLRVETDEDDPGKFLVTFTFDATVAGRYYLLLLLASLNFYLLCDRWMTLIVSCCCVFYGFT